MKTHLSLISSLTLCFSSLLGVPTELQADGGSNAPVDLWAWQRSGYVANAMGQGNLRETFLAGTIVEMVDRGFTENGASLVFDAPELRDLWEEYVPPPGMYISQSQSELLSHIAGNMATDLYQQGQDLAQTSPAQAERLWQLSAIVRSVADAYLDYLYDTLDSQGGLGFQAELSPEPWRYGHPVIEQAWAMETWAELYDAAQSDPSLELFINGAFTGFDFFTGESAEQLWTKALGDAPPEAVAALLADLFDGDGQVSVDQTAILEALDAANEQTAEFALIFAEQIEVALEELGNDPDGLIIRKVPSNTAVIKDKAADYEAWRGAAQGALIMTTELLRLAGVAEQEVKIIRAVGSTALSISDSYVKFADALTKYATLGDALSTVAFTGNVVGAVSSLVGVLIGAPTQEELILDRLDAIQEQLNNLGQYMQERFDLIDQQLVAIQQQLGLILIELGNVAADLNEMQRALYQLQSNLSRFESNIYAMLAYGLRVEYLRDPVARYLDQRSLTELQFEDGESDLYVHGYYNAFSPTLSLPVTYNHDSTIQLDLLWTESPVSHLNTINQATMNVLGLSPLDVLAINPSSDRDRLPNPTDWITASKAYVKLFYEWPEYAPQIEPYRAQGLAASGRRVRNAIRKITYGPDTYSQDLFGAAFDWVTQRAADVEGALSQLEFDMLKEVRANATDDREVFVDLYSNIWYSVFYPYSDYFFYDVMFNQTVEDWTKEVLLHVEPSHSWMGEMPPEIVERIVRGSGELTFLPFFTAAYLKEHGYDASPASPVTVHQDYFYEGYWEQVDPDCWRCGYKRTVRVEHSVLLGQWQSRYERHYWYEVVYPYDPAPPNAGWIVTPEEAIRSDDPRVVKQLIRDKVTLNPDKYPDFRAESAAVYNEITEGFLSLRRTLGANIVESLEESGSPLSIEINGLKDAEALLRSLIILGFPASVTHHESLSYYVNGLLLGSARDPYATLFPEYTELRDRWNKWDPRFSFRNDLAAESEHLESVINELLAAGAASGVAECDFLFEGVLRGLDILAGREDPNRRKDQAVTFDGVSSSVKQEDSPLELRAIASSGLPVTVEVQSGPGTYDPATHFLSMTGPGTLQLRVTVDGNWEFNPLDQIKTVTVTAPSMLVLNTNDSGPGSLREAIDFTSPEGVITFTNTLSGQTILLTSGQLYVDKGLTIDASSLTSGIIIDGNASSRIFEYAPRTTNTLKGLILTNGQAVGGAILARAKTLKIINCSFLGNSGGAIHNSGVLTINSSLFSGNSNSVFGGAIANCGMATINSSIFSGNSAKLGGGIYSRPGTLTMNNSTVSDNCSEDGGGIYIQDGTATINNSTLSGNSALSSGSGDNGGGIYNNNSTLMINSSTLSGNSADGYGGGIYNYYHSTLTINNSTLSANSAGDIYGGGGGCVVNSQDSTTMLTNSIVAGNATYNINGFSGSHNLVDVEPMLAPLGDYGGPTHTMPLLPGSPAIDVGIDTGSLPATDQRGNPRVVNGIVDIGAVEFRGPLNPTLTVSRTTLSPGCSHGEDAPANTFKVWNSGEKELSYSVSESVAWLDVTPTSGTSSGERDSIRVTYSTAGLAPGIYNGMITITAEGAAASPQTVEVTLTISAPASVVLNTNDSGPGSLREAIATTLSGGVITFTNTLSGQTILLTSGELLVKKSLTIDASPLPEGIIIDGNSNSRIFKIYYGTTNTLAGLVLTNGTDGYGGAIHLSGKDLTLAGCTLASNSGSCGGAIWMGAGPILRIHDSTFCNNSASYSGGAIHFDYITNYSSGSLMIDSSTFTSNSADLGGGIYSEGPLTLTNSILSDNSGFYGGGIYNTSGSTLTMNNSTLNNNRGSAILNGGTLTINNSTLSGNSAPESSSGGGGIQNYSGSLTINNSTLSGNSGSRGGGIYNGYHATNIIDSSTVSGNSAGQGGGIYIYSGTLTINHSTISGNLATNIGGGIYGYAELTNSIVAGNVAPAYTNVSSSFVGSHNLIDVDPMLAPLGDYGGPTQTMPPLPGSPAIDAGLDTGSLPTSDQRGYPRVINDTVDIGAVEYWASPGPILSLNPAALTQASRLGSIVPSDTFEVWNTGIGTLSYSISQSADWLNCTPTNGNSTGSTNIITVTYDPDALAPGTHHGTITVTDPEAHDSPQEIAVTLTVNTTSFTVLNTNDSGNGSLRDGIARTLSGGMITFTNTLSGQTILLTGSQLHVDKDLTIDASALTRGIIIDGNASSRIFEFASGTSNTLKRLTLTNGLASGIYSGETEGGAILVGRDARLTIVGCSMTGNSAQTYGGAICNGVNSEVTLDSCTLSGNSAGNVGGAIHNYRHAQLTINDCTLSGNSSANSGGAIYNHYHALLTIINSTLSGNSATNVYGNGGAICNSDSEAMLDSCTLSANSAASGGGVSSGGTLTINNCLLCGNIATGNGGGIRGGGTVTINGSMLFSNSASVRGGGIHSSGALTISDSTLSANDAGDGGGVYNESCGRLAINMSRLSNNSATNWGGGICNYYYSAVSLDSSTVSGNSANQGGGIYNDYHATNIVNNSTLCSNSAALGGGIYSSNFVVNTIENSTVSGNSADDCGGGIYSYRHVTDIINNCTVSGNSADDSGGGIFTQYQSAATITNSNVAGNSAATNSNIDGSFTGSHNLTNGIPLLAPLGDYGGPTQTMPPLPGSPAIDAGLDTGSLPVADQRGYPRIVNGIVDIGAVEFQGALDTTLAVNPTHLTPTCVQGTNAPSESLEVWNSGQAALGYTVSESISWLSCTPTNGVSTGETNAITVNYTTAGLTPGIYTGVITVTATGAAGSPRVVVVTVKVTTSSSVVLNTNDSGLGSLRRAVTYTSPGGIITFTNTLSGRTIRLTSGQILVDKSLSIDASSLPGGIRIDGNARSRIFQFASGTQNTLKALTLTHGSEPEGYGGAIRVGSASLTINKCTISYNNAQYGGGIYTSSGTLTINDSTLSGNSATRNGGGIDISHGTLRINNSTLNGNTASSTWYGSGGGIFGSDGTLRLNNSTLSGNYAHYHGGGIYMSSSTLMLTNTVVAGNTGANIYYNPLSSTMSGTHNLTSGDPLLAPWGDYGGPTKTMPPLPGSPAIDAGLDTGSLPATDQRRFARVVNSTVDIGAVEFQGSSDVARFWSSDWDGDGRPFGIELALGANPLVADPDGFGYPASYPPGMGNGIIFGFNPAATNYTAWVVRRSADLSVPDSFVEVFRFDGPTGVITQADEVFFNFTTDVIRIIDFTTPPPPSGFYELSIELSP